MYLIHHVNDVNKVVTNGLTLLHVACYAANVPICRALIDTGAYVNIVGYMKQTPLHMLCKEKDIIVEEIIDEGVLEQESFKYRDKLVKKMEKVLKETSH